jgi:hypothetical protein
MASLVTAFTIIQLAGQLTMLARDWSLVIMVASNGVYLLDQVKKVLVFCLQPMICGSGHDEKKMADLILSCWQVQNLMITCGENVGTWSNDDTIDQMIFEVEKQTVKKQTSRLFAALNTVVSLVRRG